MFVGRNYEGMLEASHRANELRYGVRVGDMLGAMDKVQSHDEDTQGSGSGSGSGFSDLSALENETDDFGRRLLQHQRDAQRLKAIHGNQQAFRKARPRPRVAELLEREEREAAQVDRQKHVHERPSSDDSHGFEPPVTVPREWGRKAKKQKDWMRKILEPSEPSMDGDDGKDEDGGAIFTHKTALTGDPAPWEGTGRLRQSLEKPQSAGDISSTSLRHMNTTLRPSTDLEDDLDLDFSSTSLLTSTPVTNRATRKTFASSQREIEKLEQHRVTTRTLEQMEERSPNGAMRRTSNLGLRQRTTADGSPSKRLDAPRPASVLGSIGSPSRIPRRSMRSPERNKENLQPNGDAHGTKIHRNVLTSADSAIPSLQSSISNITHRPTHARSDSMSLLRKLARVSMLSPNTANGRHNGAAQASKDGDVPSQRPLSANAADDIRDMDAPPRLQAVQNDGKGSRRASAGRLTYDKATKPRDHKQSSAPASYDQTSEAKTPVVTGAWVDTFLDSGETDAAARPSTSAGRADEGTDEGSRRRQSTSGHHPTSALSAILQESKKGQQGEALGESTIQSLEDIVDPNLEPTDPTASLNLEAPEANTELDQQPLLTQEEKDQRQQALAIEGLNKHLRAARTSIKDASKGLRRVEHQIDQSTLHDGTLPLPPPPNPSPNTTVIVARRPASYGFVPCETCGGSYQHIYSALWGEFTSCFYTWSPTSKPRLHFTPLGLWCTCFLLWYTLENMLCLLFCHPFITSRGYYNVDPWNTPRYPFVIPTLLFGRPLRWFLGEDVWFDVWQFLDLFWRKEVFERFITGGDRCYGLSLAECNPYKPKQTIVLSTSAFGGARRAPSTTSSWVGTATATAARVSASLVEAVDRVGSIWDDELVL